MVQRSHPAPDRHPVDSHNTDGVLHMIRMTRQQWTIAIILMAVILTGNLGGIIWALNW